MRLRHLMMIYTHVHLSSQDVGLWWVDISNKCLLIQNFPPFIVLRTHPRGGDVMGHAIPCFMKMVSNLICLRYSDAVKKICPFQFFVNDVSCSTYPDVCAAMYGYIIYIYRYDMLCISVCCVPSAYAFIPVCFFATRSFYNLSCKSEIDVCSKVVWRFIQNLFGVWQREYCQKFVMIFGVS